MLCIKEEFDRELQVLKKRDLSCIRVGIQQIRAPHVVPPLTMAVKQEFPKLDVVFNENHGENLFNMLERGEIDLLLHNHMRQIPGISAEFLMKDRLLFITPKNHLLNAYGIKSAKPYPWIDLSWFKNENFMLLPEAYTLRTCRTTFCLFRMETRNNRDIYQNRDYFTPGHCRRRGWLYF